MSNLGIVIIGRNEGERLRCCLNSPVDRGLPMVYVDSDSTDGSVGLARALGADVVELDRSLPFTAARARNEGFARLDESDPAIHFVQFVDGDCELAAGWLDEARRVLEERPDVAAVFGRRRERHPEQTLYNRLADLEWNTPIGEAKHFGGDVLVRADAFRQAGGYDPTLIAGEDPDLSVRMRQHGWTILRIDAEMTRHDMAMTRFAQWWRRTVRAGHAYAEGAARFGRAPERHFVRQVRSSIFWGSVVPLLILVLALIPSWPSRVASLVLLGGYAALFWRTERYYRSQRGWPAADARLYAAFCVMGKFPEMVGIAKYGSRRIRGRPARLIEYRGNPADAPDPHPRLDAIIGVDNPSIDGSP